MINLNNTALGAVAGLIAGLFIGGIGSRIAMRMVAIIGDMQPGFTLAGSLAILLLAALIGILFGLIYGLTRRFIPASGLWKGVFFGGLLALLTTLPFLLSPEGELALISPLVGASLFFWIPLAYGVALEWLVKGFERRYQGIPERQVSVALFAILAVSLFVALFSLFSLMQEFLSMPALVVRTARVIGFDDFRTFHVLMMLLFALLYCGLCALIFWQGSGDRFRSFAAVALLLFAAGFFNDGRVFTNGLDFLNVGDAMSGLMRVVGLTLLLVLLLYWPDGSSHSPRTRWLVWFWGAIWFFVLFLAQLLGLDSSFIPEALLLMLVLGGLLSGLVVQYSRYQSANEKERYYLRPVIAGPGVVFFGYLLIWILQIVYPDLRARGVPLMATPFTFLPFLMPWLLLPLSFWLSLRRLTSQTPIMYHKSNLVVQT